MSDSYRQKYAEAMIAAGHSPHLDEDGEIDMFYMSYDIHNGPQCILCHRSWCEHCTKPENIEPCDADIIEGVIVVRALEDHSG